MNPQIVAVPFEEPDKHVAELDRRIASLERRKTRLQALAVLQGEVHKLECLNLTALPADHRAAAAIVQIVCSHFCIPRDALLGPSRAEPLVHYRHIAMCLLHEVGNHNLRMVANAFGKHHTSTLHAVRKTHDLCDAYKAFATDFKFIKHRFLKTLKELHENPLP